MLQFSELVDGTLYEIFYTDGVCTGCGERGEIEGLATDGVFGVPVSDLRFQKIG